MFACVRACVRVGVCKCACVCVCARACLLECATDLVPLSGAATIWSGYSEYSPNEDGAQGLAARDQLRTLYYRDDSCPYHDYSHPYCAPSYPYRDYSYHYRDYSYPCSR
jgi:hypothetical protein